MRLSMQKTSLEKYAEKTSESSFFPLFQEFQRSGHIEGGDLKRFIALCEDVPESGHFRRKAKRNWAKVRKSIRRYSSFEQ